jgi:hypothetical protein
MNNDLDACLSDHGMEKEGSVVEGETANDMQRDEA